MPVKLGSKLPAEPEARIEIIPLIDIMFFLLAAFMLVSLSLVNSRTVKVNLPSASTSSVETKRSDVSLSVDRTGASYWDREPMGANELRQRLSAARQTNETLRVSISGDSDARHGDIVRVLDIVRSAGIQRVAFEIRSTPEAPSTPPRP